MTPPPPVTNDSAGELATASSALTSSCTPDSVYDSCLEVDLSQVQTWQATHKNPTWRSITSSHDPTIDHEITIDVDELNGGVIPTDTDQGDYESYDEYLATMNRLLGADITAETLLINVIGSTVKLAENGDPVPESTGVLLYDALSDENGKIFINGQDWTETLLHPNRFHNFDQEIDGQGSLPSNQLTVPLSYGGIAAEEVDYELLTDGPYEGDLEMYYRASTYIEEFDDPPNDFDILVPGELTVSINDISYQFHSTKFTCLFRWFPDGSGGFLAGTLRRHCVESDYLEARVEMADPHHMIGPAAYDSPARVVETTLTWVDSFGNREGCGFGDSEFVYGVYADDDEVFTPNVDPSNCFVLGGN